MKEQINRIELELKDWKEIEQGSTETIRTGLKMIATAQLALLKAEEMIKNLGDETERERIARVREEKKKLLKNNTRVV